ncbi:2,3-butanediol dehydrogenase, S-alcohol forming, (R)-acetoin-specific / Acetoin (diacetyl) reductase [Leuconostoc gelidum subsp. gasicomitatum]|uniref:diacetyl reductase [(S)-acetoin forming] n=1 Tax=Leuconostoc gasicomitatum TaxID=115778 RepID=A0A9Q3SXF0_9LACO|nr:MULTISPECIES: (S)-acetoin forming diacetyl reductase [Leuconostoc gelidum group]MBZ5944117.1 (S)-acetoin forming diacetyl reductase [Leuconostoc gasicomitatum]MBZ5946173.1 (S)-acetoin forming diacetyl reductase [Leuconostoc gasicomitatum]MBZ5949586.1 (S)-acetoin forming diacetyl reductase [Leuconostoc gasicomitatum]MBZ5950673.1 (S)-acetoin forming diacetyl reductase [Leuconostoc gasicomitatum]MBZ5962629.1 (S)-acetoin forming diacetyl reductase [Leuconostoc gasicomitatum]
MSKVALVTGAGQGIGKAIAHRLVKDGFQVSLIGRHLEKVQRVANDINANGGEAIAIRADVAKRDEVFEAVKATKEAFGDLNVIVNNAGVAPTTPIMAVTEDDMNWTWGINVNGVVWGTQAATEAFKELGHGGKIINATSQAGVEGNENLTVYGSTKFAIRGITQTTAKELAQFGITVNAFAPGIVKTPMMWDIAHEVGQNAGKDDEWGMAQFSDGIALGRLSEPEEIASVVSFLSSDDSNYVTGQTIIVDGGMVFH